MSCFGKYTNKNAEKIVISDNRKYDTKKFNSFNDSFNARGIMEQYGSEEWGEYAIPELHLSQRFVYDENGYYHCCASFPLPKNMQAD